MKHIDESTGLPVRDEEPSPHDINYLDPAKTRTYFMVVEAALYEGPCTLLGERFDADTYLVRKPDDALFPCPREEFERAFAFSHVADHFAQHRERTIKS